MNNMPNLSLIEKMIENDELDSADRELTKLEKIIKAAQPADDDDDEDLEDDPAEEDDSDEDGEDEDDGMQKLGPRTLPPRYPHDDLTDAFVNHQNIGADVTPTKHSPLAGTYATGVTDVVQQPMRHAFDDEVDRIKQRDGVSRSAAMSRARIENPALYTAYQQFLSGQTTSQQAMARSRVMEKMSDSDKEQLREAGAAARGKKKKRPRQQTHEDAVADQVAKGFDPVTAEQRVLHQYGNTLPRRNDELAKAADSIISKFMRMVDQEMRASRCERHEAMRKVRLAEPDLYEAYTLV